MSLASLPYFALYIKLQLEHGRKRSENGVRRQVLMNDERLLTGWYRKVRLRLDGSRYDVYLRHRYVKNLHSIYLFSQAL